MSDHEQKLRELGGKLARLYTAEEMAVWLFSANHLLGGLTPAALIQQRWTHEIIRLIDQILEGACLMEMRYLLKSRLPAADWIEVTREEWIRAERRAGFRPKLSSDHPDYMKVCATGGFGSDFIYGKIERI